MEAKTIKQRRALCKELGLFYDGITSHGDSLILLDRLIHAMDLLERAEPKFEDGGPDVDWHRDFFLLTGDHMICTDEGWQPGDTEPRPDADEILCEVNAPEASTLAK
jgi:hypothetical protein